MQGAILAVTAVVFGDYLVITYKVTRILKMSRRDLPLFADFGKLAVAAFIAGIAAEITRRLMAGVHPASRPALRRCPLLRRIRSRCTCLQYSDGRGNRDGPRQAHVHWSCIEACLNEHPIGPSLYCC